MNEIKTERIEFDYNENYVICRYCQTKITPENEKLPRIDYKETEILNLKQQVQNLRGEIGGLKQELVEMDTKL